MAAFDCINQSKIFREITAWKFEGQHATQLNRYEGLCPATKTEIHRGFSNGILRNFRAASRINSGGCFWKENGGEGCAVTLVCDFRFSLFPGQLFIY